jgi:hypothetical protein
MPTGPVTDPRSFSGPPRPERGTENWRAPRGGRERRTRPAPRSRRLLARRFRPSGPRAWPAQGRVASARVRVRVVNGADAPLYRARVCPFCPNCPAGTAGRTMITETLQQIRCGISTKSEITLDHAAARGRAPRACPRTVPTGTMHHSGKTTLACTWSNSRRERIRQGRRLVSWDPLASPRPVPPCLTRPLPDISEMSGKGGGGDGASCSGADGSKPLPFWMN